MSIETSLGFDSDEELDAKAGPDLGGKVCNRCGCGGLHWEETSSGWRLHEANSEMHRCFAPCPGCLWAECFRRQTCLMNNSPNTDVLK